jgi:hypothetical protein
MNSDPFPRRLSRFKTRLSRCARARSACGRTNANAASTHELKDESQPSQPAGLGGGERAQRHRAMRNRRHNFLRWSVESRDSRRFGTGTPIYYGRITRFTQHAKSFIPASFSGNGCPIQSKSSKVLSESICVVGCASEVSRLVKQKPTRV